MAKPFKFLPGSPPVCVMFEALHAENIFVKPSKPAHQIFIKCFLFHEHETWQVTKMVKLCIVRVFVCWP